MAKGEKKVCWAKCVDCNKEMSCFYSETLYAGDSMSTPKFCVWNGMKCSWRRIRKSSKEVTK